MKPTEAAFVMIGTQPGTSWPRGVVALGERGFALAGGSDPFDQTPYAANVAAIYVVRDVGNASVKTCGLLRWEKARP